MSHLTTDSYDVLGNLVRFPARSPEMNVPDGPPDIPRVLDIGRRDGIAFLLDGDH